MSIIKEMKFVPIYNAIADIAFCLSVTEAAALPLPTANSNPVLNN